MTKIEEMYTSKNKVLKDKTISGKRIVDQVGGMPPPKSKTKSGYPHKYENNEDVFSIKSGSSTKSFYEAPVLQRGSFNFNKKKDETINPPGAFRYVTNQRGTFKGIMAHDGKDNRPSGGGFHRCDGNGRPVAG